MRTLEPALELAHLETAWLFAGVLLGKGLFAGGVMLELSGIASLVPDASPLLVELFLEVLDISKT
jgi:hypothetical protein